MTALTLESANRDEWGGLRVLNHSIEGSEAVVVGVPFEGGSGGRSGASLGPDHVRQISRRLKTICRRGRDFSHLRIADLGNVPVERLELPGAIATIGATYENIFASVNVPVLTLGGDHSITYPIAAAAAKEKRLGVVWFDAHPDVLDTYCGTSLSHGSPLRRLISGGYVRGQDVIIVGSRAYDKGEPAYLSEQEICEVRAVDFETDRLCAMGRYKRALLELASRVENIYVSVDIDVLDACHVPGTATPVSGGISPSVLLQMLEELPDCVLAYDVVEFCPGHDVADVTCAAVLSILTTVFGQIALNARGRRVNDALS
jgi:agmatinase